MSDLEQTLKLKHLSQELVSLAVAKDTLLDSIFELADREVDGTPSCTYVFFEVTYRDPGPVSDVCSFLSY